MIAQLKKPEFNTAERRSRLHSTDLAAILGLSPFKTEREVFLEKHDLLEPEKGSSSTEAGTILEPSILTFAEQQLGPINRNVLCVTEEYGCPMAATLDGQHIATGQVVEAKTSGITGPIYGDWGDAGSDLVPPYYLVQIVVQFICSGADVAHLFALLGGRGIVAYRIERDEAVVDEIAERGSRWWERCISRGIEPTATEPLPLEVIKRLRRQPEKTVELCDPDAILVAEWEAAKATRSAAEKACDVSQAKVLSLLGDAEAGRLPDGRLVTYLQSTRKGYSVDETTFRTLRIKKG